MNRFRVLGWISLLPDSGPHIGRGPVLRATACRRSASPPADNAPRTALATFGGGCFWCVEAVFEPVDGVANVESGYAGGTAPQSHLRAGLRRTHRPRRGGAGHLRPGAISYEDLLEVFWKIHDPTTLNRQGADIGPQYRSVIFYHNDQQKALAEKYRRELDTSGAWDRPIVTAVEPLTTFYKAEDYHQSTIGRILSKATARSSFALRSRSFARCFPISRSRLPSQLAAPGVR